MTDKYAQLADRLQQWGSARQHIARLREQPFLTQQDIEQGNKGLQDARDLVNDLQHIVDGLERDIEHAMFELEHCEDNMLLKVDRDDTTQQDT